VVRGEKARLAAPARIAYNIALAVEIRPGVVIAVVFE
jgi:hypothetical protein